MTDSSFSPLAGLWKPTHLKQLYYGSDSVKTRLIDCLPSDSSRAFIITGSSLANKTQLIHQVEAQLGDRHAGTFSGISQHAPIKALDEAADLVKQDDKIDTIISIGGGSPIDSAKAISYRVNQQRGRFLHHIAIPTTLSAAECSMNAGFTDDKGNKTGVSDPGLAPHAIIYDATFALETPPWLWMSTGLRALDHAMELMYHPTATELCRWMCMVAASELFKSLPLYKQDPKDVQTITRLQLASFGALGYLGLNVKGGLGLSHALGYALGSPYGIPHGITSCLTLGHVVKLKARRSRDDAKQIARMVPFVGLQSTGNDVADAEAVGEAVLELVRSLDLQTTLSEQKVGRDQIPVIAKTASGSDSGPLYDEVHALIESIL